MKITNYALRIYNTGDGSNGEGTVQIDNGPAQTVTWSSGGRSLTFTLDGADVENMSEIGELLNNFTEPFEIVDRRFAQDDSPCSEDVEDWHAFIANGQIMWLIGENHILVGTLINA